MSNLQTKCLVTMCCLVLNVFSGVVYAKSDNASSKKVTTADLQKAYQRLVVSSEKQSGLRRNARKNGAKQGLHLRKTSVRNQILLTAKKQLRKKYRWGGASPKRGFDCSGLVQYAYKSGNVKLPRTAAEQYRFTKRVSLAHLKAGDLIFFHTRRRSRSRVNHVGIYMGGGNFIHAPRRGQRVSIAKLSKYWKKRAIGAGRV